MSVTLTYSRSYLMLDQRLQLLNDVARGRVTVRTCGERGLTLARPLNHRAMKELIVRFGSLADKILAPGRAEQARKGIKFDS